jgi:hypothetical protein
MRIPSDTVLTGNGELDIKLKWKKAMIPMVTTTKKATGSLLTKLALGIGRVGDKVNPRLG